MKRPIDADELMQMLGITSLDCPECGWYSGNEYAPCTRGGDFEDACFAICTLVEAAERNDE